MALTCVTSLECVHSLSSQAMVSGGEDYPLSFHQKKKPLTLCYFPLYFFAFCFVPAVLQWMRIQHSVLLHHCWNELFQFLLEQHKAEHKWYKTDKDWMISKQMLLSLNIILCFHVTGVAAEISFMPLWGAAKTIPVLTTAAVQPWHDVKSSSSRGKCSSLCSVMADECDTPSHSNLCSQLTLLSFILFTCNLFIVTFWGVVCLVKLMNNLLLNMNEVRYRKVSLL